MKFCISEKFKYEVIQTPTEVKIDILFSNDSCTYITSYNLPTIQPSNNPTIHLCIILPTNHPSIQPSNHSTIQPSNHSTIQPFNHFKHLTIQPSNYPIIQPYSVKLYQLTSRRSATWYLERSSEMSHVSVAISCSRRADWVRLVCRASRAFM